MSYTQKFAGVILSIFVSLSCGVVAVAQVESDIDQLIEAPGEINRFSSESLEVLKSNLPDLHVQVSSSEWDGLSGLEKQRTAAQAVLPALGSKSKDVNDLLQRLETFDLDVPPRRRNTVDMAMGRVSESLIDSFIHIQKEKEWVALLNEALSRGKDLYPDEVAEATSCLNSAVSRKGKQFILFFEDWIKSLENLTDKPEDESFDVSVIKYSSNFATDLVGHIVAINKDYRSCRGEMELHNGDTE